MPVDIALPCATQNELDVDAAQTLIANGVKAVAEGANMPTTIAATDLFVEAGVLFAPGKAANAWCSNVRAGNGAECGPSELEGRKSRYSPGTTSCLIFIRPGVDYGGEGKQTQYVRGANIAGFVKVADAMLAQGVL